MGPFAEETTNDNSRQRLIQLCETYNLKVNNSFFKHTNIHRYTNVQNFRNLKSIIDYVISKQKTNLQFNDVRVLRESTCGSNHFLVKFKIRMRFRDTRNCQGDQIYRIANMETLTIPRYNFDSVALVASES